MRNGEYHAGKFFKIRGNPSWRSTVRFIIPHSLLAFLLFYTAVANSQGYTPVTKVSGPPAWPKLGATATPWTAAGDDFYACFPSVVGSNDADPTIAKLRSLFISSRAPARVTVEVLRTAFDTTFTVTPGQYARVNIPLYDALNPLDDEVTVSKVVHIYSKEIISVYGYSHNSLSSDGFLIFPTPVLGTSYFAVSTRNAVNYKVGSSETSLDTLAPNPRSEFAIVATQNNTTVTFRLTATSYSGLLEGDSTYSIRLDRGQAYSVMAHDTGTRLTTYLPDRTLNWWDGYAPWNGGPDCDLTGSYITSDKPIAVFSGHERAAAPAGLEYDYAGISRDHLVEEMMPVSAWGKNYIVTSLGQDSKNGRRAGGDAVRVVAAFDNTHITVNGTLAYTLARGGYADFFSGNASLIQSDEPVLVAHFMQCSNTSIDPMGDPDLTLARPIEDYANEYTLPPATDASIFTEPHTLIICDSSTEKTTVLNDSTIRSTYWNSIPGTTFVVGIVPAATTEQRVQSPLPCYAETFAYGIEDSYAFAGGGDFLYVDSLLAQNVDFKAVAVGKNSTLTSPLKTPDNGNDTVHIYGFEWVSGDTSNFTLLGGTSQTLAIPPHGSIPLPYRFAPSAPKYYSAILRVWSDAVNAVKIRLQGEGVAPSVTVIPDTIDFGRVRLGTKRDSMFTILNDGTDSIALIDLDYKTSLAGTEFTADSIAADYRGGPHTLPPGFNNSVSDPVHFLPTKLGVQTAFIPIYWTDVPTGILNSSLAVVLIGTGVEPNITSAGHDFGSLRVDSTSTTDTFFISNRGSDVTIIDSVTILDSSGLSDFTVNLDSLPPGGSRKSITLGYEGGDTALHFTVQFVPHTLGAKQLVLRIHTLDAGTLYDTFLGRGIEPLVLVAPDTIDFGMRTILPSQIAQPGLDTTFTVTNVGTMAGLLDSLIYDHGKHFTVQLNQPGDSLHESLDTSAMLTGLAHFDVVEEGDFLDTVYLKNDTRYGLYPQYANYRPAIILRASVRTGPIGSDTLDFGTITTCDPDTQYVLIHNPYPVEVHIDSIGLLADTGGFSLPDNFVHVLNIPPDSSYALPIIFAFPPDSLNGTQELILGLFQRELDGENSAAYTTIVDTVTAKVVRKQRTFALHAHLPTYPGSANDVNFLKLPITVDGPRAGVAELNSWTLSLKFSNDLFEPVGIDTTNALAVWGDSTFTINTYWDQATRTYTITVTGSAVSDSAKIANDLLLSILMRAYLTKDTVVTVTPTFTWAHHPCAYNLQSFTLSIPYGDDCGDPTIRAFMRGDNPFFDVIGAWPNPVDRNNGITISYKAAAAGTITARVYNEAGEETGTVQVNSIAGAGTLSLPPNMLPHSGAAFVRLESVPAFGGLPVVRMVSVEITN